MPIDINEINYDQNSNNVQVGGGCIWKDLILELYKYNRTVAEMQSYYNFSVGGSISVNCHSRNIKYGSISDTILSITPSTLFIPLSSPNFLK